MRSTRGHVRPSSFDSYPVHVQASGPMSEKIQRSSVPFGSLPSRTISSPSRFATRSTITPETGANHVTRQVSVRGSYRRNDEPYS